MQPDDTLQAIAVRYSCSVADIKRLNKIERDYEIHARKTLQVPLTADNILADHSAVNAATASSSSSSLLSEAQLMDVMSAQLLANGDSRMPPTFAISAEPTINDIILNTRIERNPYAGGDRSNGVTKEDTIVDDLGECVCVWKGGIGVFLIYFVHSRSIRQHV